MRQEECAIRILAIDDDPSVLDSYQVLFGQRKSNKRDELDELALLLSEESESKADHPFPIQLELTTVTSGEQGFKLAHQEQYGVILLDMRMPGGWDGMETARNIRRVDQQVRIILITAYMDYTLEQLREEIGVNFAYLQKPFDRNELIQMTLLLANDWEREQRLIEAERAMAEAARVAERANKAKDEFLASMSHELRTPLTSLLGNCELMHGSDLDQMQNMLLNSMEVSGKSLLYLINDVLDSSKIEAGLFEIDEVEFDPRSMIEELRMIFSSRASDAGVAFEIEMEHPFGRALIGDGRRLSQVLINLLSNAIKFTSQGSVRLRVATDPVAQQLSFAVEDSGIGMDEETQQRIFKPFEQADRSISGRFGGTGLGLHISWNLVQLMGGSIEVSSTLGSGSCFTVTLPLREGAELLEERALQQTELPLLPLRGRVLIAEDTPELQVLERRMIESQTGGEVEVEIAGDGRQALEKIATSAYDLVLMDMQMPVMDGIAATEQLRAQGNRIPVVALTANVMQKQREQFYKAGCDDFLSKPIDRSSLRSILKKYLARSTGEQRQQEPEPQFLAHTREQGPNTAPAVVDPMVDDELMMLFRERSMTLRSELLSAYEVGEWEKIEQVAHTIKGSGSSFGFPQLTILGGEVQNLVKAGEFERAATTVERLSSALSEV